MTADAPASEMSVRAFIATEAMKTIVEAYSMDAFKAVGAAHGMDINEVIAGLAVELADALIRRLSK